MDLLAIEKEIHGLIRQIRPDIDTGKLKSGDWLTSSEHGFTGLNLAYLFFEIESKFNITLDGEKLRNYEFVTVGGIVRAVQKALAKEKAV